MKALLAVLGILGALLFVGISSYFSAATYGNAAEKGIIYAQENNQNILAQYTTKIQTMAQVPGMATDDMTKVINAAIQGRYGKDGSKAVFQMIKEVNPTVDQSLYLKLEQVIESGRDEFQNAQTQLIDKKRAYDTELGSPYKGFWLRLAGYPKIDLKSIKTIINDHTEETYKTGKEKQIKLR